MDVQAMTDEQHRLDRAREWASAWFRAEGRDELAECVERGELGNCSEMRLGWFFNGPPQPLTEEFIRAWNEFAEQDGERRNRRTF